MLGVWPIIMGITMWFQMKLNPTPPDPTQKMIFDWMPLIFTFMLAGFPAGLVIYWAWNNLLSVLQQSYIMRKNGVKVELFDNIKADVWPEEGRREDVTAPALGSWSVRCLCPSCPALCRASTSLRTTDDGSKTWMAGTATPGHDEQWKNLRMNADIDAKLIEEGRKLFAGEWKFVWASPSIETLPPMAGMEVAFAGRSNVGKSSLINALTGRNALARTSHTPGRTQELIFFDGPDNAGLRLVDMPGYGYASAPKTKVASWTKLIHQFLQGRATLARVYVLIDARHGIKDVDQDVLKTLDKSAVSYQVVLTKADQVKKAELEKNIERDHGRARQAPGRVSGSAGDILALRRRHAGIARRDGAPVARARLMSRTCRILIVLAAIMGADGVMLAAASAHGADASRLASASSMLLFHASAVLGAVALAERGIVHGRIGIAAAFGFVIAASLFAGDLTLRHYAGHGLFPMAAPTGGTLLIASWLALAVAAAWPKRG